MEEILLGRWARVLSPTVNSFSNPKGHLSFEEQIPPAQKAKGTYGVYSVL
jgi:hypothetical protein